MTFEKFHGNTVGEARKKAKDKLGESHIVVESREASNGEPAWVNVLNEGYQDSKKTDTYSRQDLFPKALSKLKKTVNESLSVFNMNNYESQSQPLQNKPQQKTHHSNTSNQSSRTYSKTAAQRQSDETISSNTNQNTSLKKEIKTLTQRFDQLEQLISDQITASNNHYTSHPAFQQLLASGVPHNMIAYWFDELFKEGINPYDKRGNFRQLLADKVKQTLDIADASQPAKVMLFTGQSVSGKSSLMMKLTLRLTSQDDTSCALVSVFPAERENFYSPLEKFTSEYSLKYYTVQKSENINKLMNEWTDYDHILIEMLPGKRQNQSSLSVENFSEILTEEDSISFEIHHVINAALNQECLDNQHFSNKYIGRCYLAFTHLDNTSLRGQLLPIMQQSRCKVRYVTAGPNIPDDISLFKPEKFAKQLFG
jgi:flagellar biosynthesis GTPase FlhF